MKTITVKDLITELLKHDSNTKVFVTEKHMEMGEICKPVKIKEEYITLLKRDFYDSFDGELYTSTNYVISSNKEDLLENILILTS